MTAVGLLAALWRYPVKSMGAEALDEVQVSWHGLAGDRRWAFVRAGRTRSGFPWLTIRQHRPMCRYRPWFADPARPDASRTMVSSPAGRVFEVTDPALAAELGDGVRVMKLDRGTFDAMPLSLVTTHAVEQLGAMVGTPLDVLRFRPNLVIEAFGGGAFPEEEWVGRTLRIGQARIRVDRRDQRCVVITVDPATGERHPSVLRAVTRERDACLGVYGSTVQPGRMAVGDLVSVEDLASELPQVEGALGS